MRNVQIEDGKKRLACCTVLVVSAAIAFIPNHLVVTLPNGGDVKIDNAGSDKYSAGEGVVILRDGSLLQVMSASAYGGGNGAIFFPE